MEKDYTEFKDKVVVITGGASGIGKVIADEFKKQGSLVYVIDLLPGDHYMGDISKKEVLEDFVNYILLYIFFLIHLIL